MTAQQTLASKKNACAYSVPVNRFNGVMRTAWCKTTINAKQRRNHKLVGANKYFYKFGNHGHNYLVADDFLGFELMPL